MEGGFKGGVPPHPREQRSALEVPRERLEQRVHGAAVVPAEVEDEAGHAGRVPRVERRRHVPDEAGVGAAIVCTFGILMLVCVFCRQHALRVLGVEGA